MALLHLLGMIAPERLRIATIVDHGLRPESAAEALRAADMARALGAEPHVLTLAWPDGARSSQDAARTARHVALAEFARARGARVVFLGHTRDDQAETVLMRREMGSGVMGLAGMASLAPSPAWPEGRGVWIARPLLGVPRAVLRTFLVDERIGWIEDPSNAAQRFARVRARARLQTSGETEALIALADDAAIRVRDAHREAAAAASLCARFMGGSISLAAHLLESPAAAAVLAGAAMAAGARLRELPADAAEGLRRRLAHDGATALGGALFVRLPRHILVWRDPGGVHGRRGGGRPHPRLDLAPGRPTVWDRRLEITAQTEGWTLAPAIDKRSTEPDFFHGSQAADGRALERNWLVEERFRRRFWRHEEPVFG
jgi:tRNA(Ile)-lysidine synthase